MIILDMSDKRPIYEQVVIRFEELISRGVLKADEQMPSVRSLAMELSINPNTIQKAYAELERDGYIYAVKGRGNYVSNIETMLPKRRQSYFEKLDDLLSQADAYELSLGDVIEHIEEYEKRGNTL